ncbi:MAG: MerR family transcriptional regulator [Microbacteriaceae bacterium]|nr:MerR family transcriptional regulator [Microbacteriaceae bacterium]
MRMSELSSTTGATVPTLKFYLREQLLHAGERTSPNQAQYDESHVRRVRLVRALLEVGGLSVARAREVVAALDAGTLPLSSVFGVAQRAVTVPTPLVDDAPAPTGGDRLVAELCAARDWRVYPNNPGLALAARVLDTYAALGQQGLHDVLEPYAEAADLVARADLAAVAAAPDETEMTNVVVVGTVLGDALFAGLRRIAQEAESFRRFPLPEGASAPTSTTTTEDC